MQGASVCFHHFVGHSDQPYNQAIIGQSSEVHCQQLDEEEFRLTINIRRKMRTLLGRLVSALYLSNNFTASAKPEIVTLYNGVQPS